MRAAIYTRFSPRPGAAECQSTAAQLDACRAYCALRRLEVVAELGDEEISGGVPMDQRPGGARLCALLSRRPRGADCVVVAALDRGWRDAADCLRTVERWQRREVSVHIVNLGGNSIDASTAAGKFMLTIMAGAAAFEREQTGERTSAAMLRRQRNGQRVSRYAPYGCALAADGRLEVSPDEQRTASTIAALANSGLSPRAIARQLAESGNTCRGNPWRHATIRAIIRRQRSDGTPSPMAGTSGTAHA